MFGEETYDESGISLSTSGDVDGDGLNDILIGAASNDEWGAEAGKVYMILVLLWDLPLILICLLPITLSLAKILMIQQDMQLRSYKMRMEMVSMIS